MNLVTVTSLLHIKEFLELPVRLYKGEPHWIRPLDKDIESVFDPKQNKLFRDGSCTRWILQDDSGTTIGRVAAFVNAKTSKAEDQPTGGMGFFECINNREAAFLLFDTCKNWLEDQGMEAMDGPINFGERDRWWGLLTEGFTDPNYGMFYHLPYYRELFEAYGFKDYFQQYTYAMGVYDPLPEKYKEKAERIARDPGYRFSTFKKNQMEKYADDFLTIYNKAWAKHGGVKAMHKSQAVSLFKKMLPIIDPDIVIFVYYEKEPIGFFIMLPEINQIIKYLNGKLDLFGKLKFLYHQWKGTCRKIFGVVFGIIPEFQGRGVEGSLVLEAARLLYPRKAYDEFEMNWIGDFNPKMIHLVETLGAKKAKTHITYRKLFDTSKPFSRAKVIV